MSDETAVLSLMDRLTTAWNDGDAAAFADQFTEDADYITFFGAHLRGSAAIEECHRPLFAGPLKGSRLTGSTQGDARPGLRFLGPDVALLVVTGGTTTAGSADPDPSRDSIMTLTAVRAADQWRFASFQNTRRTPVPGPGGPVGRAVDGDGDGDGSSVGAREERS
jgi:uncharacterized protein (TIGR02246 family)